MPRRWFQASAKISPRQTRRTKIRNAGARLYEGLKTDHYDDAAKGVSATIEAFTRLVPAPVNPITDVNTRAEPIPKAGSVIEVDGKSYIALTGKGTSGWDPEHVRLKAMRLEERLEEQGVRG